MSSGPLHAAVNAFTLARSDSSRAATSTASLPVLWRMSAATRSPVSVFRTANVTAAPAAASARAVSTPIPDDAPVTTARLPLRSTPAMTSAAVEEKPKGVLIKSGLMSIANPRPQDTVPRSRDYVLGLLGDADDQGARGVALVHQVDGFTGPDRQVVAVAAVGRGAVFGQRGAIGFEFGLLAVPCVGEAVAQRPGGVTGGPAGVRGDVEHPAADRLRGPRRHD